MTQEQAEEYSIDFADIVCSRYIHDAMQCFREGVGEYRKYKLDFEIIKKIKHLFVAVLIVINTLLSILALKSKFLRRSF